ncbi:MAG: hypothetical protein EXR77_16070 [Myxococcales bacterium]|nr:hypothetical protein [Myxococcales bacterium]
MCQCQKSADCAAQNDGNLCNGSLFCDQASHVCSINPATVVGCVPGDNPCAVNSCNPTTGTCAAVNLGDGATCSDGKACTVGDACKSGSCAAGACKGATTLDCGDANTCTQDTCQAKTGCIHLPQSSTCTDDNVCTISDTCTGGVCKGGCSFDCQDSDLCTTDACSPTKGCTHTLSTGPCDDGQFSTVADTCGAVGGCSGKALDCQGEVGGACANGLCDERPTSVSPASWPMAAAATMALSARCWTCPRKASAPVSTMSASTNN